MAFAFFNRVKESTTTTGTGALALGGAATGFQAFSARYANNDTMHYAIFHAATGAWEVGLGTWVTGNTLQRTTVLESSNADALVNFAAGTKDVFVCLPAVVAIVLQTLAFGNRSLLGVKSVALNSEVDNAGTTIDWTTGGLQKKTITGSHTLTFTAPAAFTGIQLRLIQDGTGGRPLPTFPGTVIMVGGTPYMPQGAGEELILSGYYDGTNYRFGVGIPNQLPARTTENVVVDLYPNPFQGTLATAASVNFDVAIPANKRATVTCDVYVDDGAGGAHLYFKAITIVVQRSAGSAVEVTQSTSLEYAGAGFTFTATVNGNNARFTLSNASGTTRSYNALAGLVHSDKP